MVIKASNPRLKLALHYASRGLHVLPVHAIQDGQCSCRDADNWRQAWQTSSDATRG